MNIVNQELSTSVFHELDSYPFYKYEPSSPYTKELRGERIFGFGRSNPAEAP